MSELALILALILGTAAGLMAAGTAVIGWVSSAPTEEERMQRAVKDAT